MTQPWQLRDWDLASDEVPANGGEESAPMPLSIFATGLATCFMTQVRTFSRAHGVRLNGLYVEGYFEWQPHPGATPRIPYTAERGRTFRLDIDMDTRSSLEDQTSVVAAASRGCFVEAVLSVPVVHRLKDGDRWVTCDVG